MILENPQPGDRVHWRAINRDFTGTVEQVDEKRGALVAVDGGGYVIISTASSMAQSSKNRVSVPNRKTS